MEASTPRPSAADRIAQQRRSVEQLAEKTALAKAAADALSHRIVQAGANASRALQAAAGAEARRYSELKSLWTGARKLLALLEEQEAHRQEQERRFSELFGHGQSPL
jgi:hypothetical protein